MSAVERKEKRDRDGEGLQNTILEKSLKLPGNVSLRKKEHFQDGKKRHGHGAKAGVPERSGVGAESGGGAHLGFMERKRRALLFSGLARLLTGGFRKAWAKIPMRTRCTPTRVAKITNTDDVEYSWGAEKLDLSSISGGNVRWDSPLGKQSGSFLENYCTIQPAMAHLAICLRKMKTYIHPETCTQRFLAAKFVIAKT